MQDDSRGNASWTRSYRDYRRECCRCQSSSMRKPCWAARIVRSTRSWLSVCTAGRDRRGQSRRPVHGL